MAITRVQYVPVGSVGSVTTLTVTFAAATAGNLLVAHVVVGSTASNGTCSTPSGWTLAVGPATTESGAVSDCNEYIFFKVAAGGETSQAFTDTVSSGITIQLEEWSATAGWAASPLDVVASSSNQPLTTAPVTGTTATTAQAEELWIGGITTHLTAGEAYSAPLNSFTLETTANCTGTPFFGPTSAMLYFIAAATGTAGTGVTAGTSKPFAGLIATFKTAAGSGVNVAATLSGTGSLTPGVEVNINPAPTLRGVGSLTPGVEVNINPAPVINGVGSLIPGVEVNINPAPTFNGAGSLVPGVEVNINPAPTLSGVGSLTPGVEVNINPAPTFAGIGQIQATVSTTVSVGPIPIQGTGSFSAAVLVHAGGVPRVPVGSSVISSNSPLNGSVLSIPGADITTLGSPGGSSSL